MCIYQGCQNRTGDQTGPVIEPVSLLVQGSIGPFLIKYKILNIIQYNNIQNNNIQKNYIILKFLHY
jgi:hypothetical protein